MFIINFLLDSFFYSLIVLGVIGIAVGFLLGQLPFVNTYKIPIQLISIMLTVLGVWFAGGIAKDKEYREEIEAANARAALAEEQAKTATARVEYVFLDRVQKVKDVQIIIQERIRDVSVKIDEQCRVLPDVIDIHNHAARDNTGVKK